MSYRYKGVMKLDWPAWARKKDFVKTRTNLDTRGKHNRSRHTYSKESGVHTSGTHRYMLYLMKHSLETQDQTLESRQIIIRYRIDR